MAKHFFFLMHRIEESKLLLHMCTHLTEPAFGVLGFEVTREHVGEVALLEGNLPGALEHELPGEADVADENIGRCIPDATLYCPVLVESGLDGV